MSNKTRVYFREFPEGDVIALFPDDIWDHDGNIASYQHIGQHGAANPELINELKPAKNYAALKAELERIGYVLDVIGGAK